MSIPYPPQLDRKNSDPEPYAPLLGSSSQNQAAPNGGPEHVSQSQYGDAGPYYDRPPGSSDYRDPYDDRYGERDGPSPFGGERYGHGYATYGNDQFATQETLQRPYDAREHDDPYQRQALDDPYAQRQHQDPYAFDSRLPPPGQGWNNSNDNDNNGDIELRPMSNQKSKGSRFAPSPGPLSTKDTILFATGLDRVFRLVGIKMGESAEQVIQRRRKGLPGQRYPVAAWLLTAIMCAVMVYELVQNNKLEGSPIQTKPFNFMIGPSSSTLINIGARFAPCMRLVKDVPPTLNMQCPPNLSNPPKALCNIEELCGHGGFANPGVPDQSWRFFTPIFMHVGLIHLALNMFALVLVGGEMERLMGSIPWLIVFFGGGLYGNILGGSFALSGIPSAGASGAICSIMACAVVDLALHWKYESRPGFKATILAIEFLVLVAIGYIPLGVDGLAHLGGYAMGLMLGIFFVPSTAETKRYKMILWGCRLAAIPLAIVAFVMTTNNFYTDDPNAACTWCRFLSCIPTSSNNQCKGTGLTITSS